MATYLENLTTARDNLAAKLAEVSADPKPTYSIDGQSFSWVEYYKFLTDSVDALNLQISGGEPFEEVTRGVT